MNTYCLHDIIHSFNPLPDNKNLDRSKLKACADNKMNANLKFKFVLGRVENISGKIQNTD